MVKIVLNIKASSFFILFDVYILKKRDTTTVIIIANVENITLEAPGIYIKKIVKLRIDTN